MVMCEECERKEADVDALMDGDYKKLCSQCARMQGAVVVEKPSKEKIEMSQYDRPKVRQVLNRMAGINNNNYTSESSKPQPVRNPYAHLRIPASRKNVSLDDLREVKKSNEAEEKQLNADVSQIEDIEAGVEQNKARVSWFERVMKVFKNTENKQHQEAQKAIGSSSGPAAEEPEKFQKVRIVNSRDVVENI
ncbi:MAG: hypothetical protein KKE23_02640 [Nanoarchaeota archaeon]|nr:hypothetical protein [Nanoarchaeota archaeon]